MQNLSLSELLRYGFAGAVFQIFVFIAFEDLRFLMTAADTNALAAAALLGISLTVGCILYALHRAIPYPIVYQILSKATGRVGSTLELDIARWQNSAKNGSLQPRMGEWAAQVHFLYACSWAGFSSLLVGWLASWTSSSLWSAAFSLSVLFLGAALWHHYRYQKWEKRVFESDLAL